MLFTFTTNSLQQKLRKLATNEVFTEIKDFWIDFHWKFHDNLNSIVAGFIIN